jgi:tripartite-type tricarboxylate transporter receptor subunit TctC
MSSRRRFIGFAGAAALSAAHPFAHAAAHAQAADYPARPVRLVVPFAAGGGPDVQARELAARLAVALGHKAALVVENIVGAGGILAAQNVARLAPDGHDLLLGASSHVVQKAMQPSVRFDPLTDFVHISRTATSPSVLVVGTGSPYQTLDELLSAARAAPGRLNYASGGVGSAAHLCAAALCVQAAIEAQHIPYKGSVEIVPSIVAGDTHFAFPIASTAIPQMRAGRVRALAVTSAQRMPMLPEVPTLTELRNSPDLVLDAWFGLWAPAGTPAGVVDILFEAVAQTCKDTALRARTEAAGSLLAPSTSPAEFKRFIETESAKFARLVKAARLSVSS